MVSEESGGFEARAWGRSLLNHRSHTPDRISLLGVRATGFHGVLADEKRDGQEFVVDATVFLPLARAAETDDVVDTVHYGELAERAGRDTAAFKRDVRALKELGLTESLEVGYRLSPRGTALLARP